MKYQVNKFLDTLNKREQYTGKHSEIYNNIYLWFDTYGEAKQFLIDRAKNRIAQLKKEIKVLEKKLPKLEELTEKIKQ